MTAPKTLAEVRAARPDITDEQIEAAREDLRAELTPPVVGEAVAESPAGR